MSPRKLSALTIVLVCVLLAASCFDVDQETLNRQSYGYFLRDVKTMQDMGLPTYWLGNGFTAGELDFQGPYGVGFEVEGGGVNMDYVAWLEGTPFQGTNTSLKVMVYSPDAWERVRDRLLNPVAPPPGNVRPTRLPVIVEGHEAQLLYIPQENRPLGRLRLILDLAPVVVAAEAASGGPVSPGGPDYNPFINDPDLFVQVMQDLRPYPQ